MNYITRAVSVTLAVAFSLSAAPVTWYLKGASFPDGGLLLGSFTYDADTNAYTNVRVFSTPGGDVKTSNNADTQRAGRDYSVVNRGFFVPTAKRVHFQQTGPTVKLTSGILNLEFNAALTNAGGSVDLSGNTSENWFVDNGGIIGGPIRQANAGKVVAVSATGPQTWYLSGVTLDDGSQAIGSFVYDAAANKYSEVRVDTAPGSTLTTSASYTNPFAVATFNNAVATASNVALTTTAAPAAGGRVLNLVLSAPLTNKQGSVDIKLEAASAEGTCSSASCQVNAKVTTGGLIRNVVSGSLTTTRPANFSKVVPHFVDGGKPAWQSVLTVSNDSDSPAAFTARQFGDDGTQLGVSTGLVAPRGVVFLTSPGNSVTTTQGWTRVDNAQNLSVSDQLVLQGANSAGDQQGAMNGDPLGSVVVGFSYDNTVSKSNAAKGNSIANGFAVVNPDPLNKMKILVVGYDTDGKIVATDSSLTLNPLAHTAFLFSGVPGLTALTKGQGTIKVYAVPDASSTAPISGINCLLLKFQLPSFSFANIAGTNQ